MFGVGAGALPYDADMIGIDVARIRDMMTEALDVDPAAARRRDGEPEAPTGSSCARPGSSSPPSPGRASSSPSPRLSRRPAPRAAGKYGMSLLSTAATTQAAFEALPETWRILRRGGPKAHGRNGGARALAAGRSRACRLRRASGRAPMSASASRNGCTTSPMWGICRWMRPARGTWGFGHRYADRLADRGDRHAGRLGLGQIERLERQSGGFGVFLDMAHNWADFAATRRSYELIARYVMPRFDGRGGRQEDAYRWAMARKPALAERRLGRGSRGRSASSILESDLRRLGDSAVRA